MIPTYAEAAAAAVIVAGLVFGLAWLADQITRDIDHN